MENRSLKPESSVKITILREAEDASSGRVTQMLGDTVDLHVEKPARPGDALKLEGDDVLLLGEVSSCRPEGDGFAVRVEIDHALFNTRELARLAKHLLDEAGRF